MATITSTTSGDYATGATWWGIAPVSWDKVIIAHTSTGLQQFSTDAAWYAIGATAITLTGTVLAWSYVINENVQFAWDPNYYLITNWNSVTKVLTVTPLIVAIPAVATLVMTRGHKVTVAGTVAWWDDTSTGIRIDGTLYASRVANSQLTVRWDLVPNTSWTLDYWTEADPIPAAYTATIIINDSASPAHNKWGIATPIATKWFWVRFWWASKTVDTTFTSAVWSGDTVLNVADTTGWAIGDWLSFWPATAWATITARVITAVTASTVTIGASLWAARLSWSKLMNVSSNVRVWWQNWNTYTSHISLRYGATQNVTNCIEIWPCEIRLNWWGWGMWTITTQQWWLVINYVSPTNLVNAVKKINWPMVHWYWAVSWSTVTNLQGGFTPACYEIFGNQATKITIEKIYAAWYYPCISLYSGASVDVTTIKWFTETIQVFAWNVQWPVDCNINGWYLIWWGRVLKTNWTSINFNNVEIDASNYFYDSTITAFGLITFTNCALWQTIWFWTPAIAYVMAAWEISPTIITDCTMLDTFSTDMSATGYKNQQQANYLKIVNRNLDPQRQERYVSGWRNYRSNTVHYRSKYAMTFECWNTATGITETSTIPIDASATIKLIGYVRFNAAFGTATPPTVTISGLGITPQVYTCTATADTWFKYEFDVTNPQIYWGNLTATFYAITASAGATAQCYFDGLIVSPYCTDSRHYGYLFDINAYRTVNSVIQQTNEATVGAYTGIAIDHVAQSITISSTHTIREIYDYVYYDLVQTANLWYAEWFTSTDGINFSCTYDIINTSTITGTGTVTTTQQYTGGGVSSVIIVDSTGTFNNMVITGLVANSRVRVNNATDNIELYNAVVAGTSVTIPSFWTTNKTLDVRVTNVIGLTAYLPYQATWTLTSTGASFLVSQELDTVYNANAIDGSGITEFSADYPNIQIDINDGDGATSVQRLYAWFEYTMHSSQGIITYFNGITAQDTLNYQVNTSVVNLEFDNVSASSLPIKITGAYIFRDDGTTVIYSGSKSIQMDPARAYQVWVSGLTTAQNDQLFAIWRSMWGGSGFSEIFKSNLASTRNEIIRKIEDESSLIRTNIDENNNEINSHLTVAKDSIIHTINQTETEICSDVVRTKKEIKEDNVSIRQLIRQKAKKQEEFIQKQLNNDEKVRKLIEDEADEIEKEIESIHSKEADMIETEIKKQHEMEADEIESNL